jgi:hypothetical protein
MGDNCFSTLWLPHFGQIILPFSYTEGVRNVENGSLQSLQINSYCGMGVLPDQILRILEIVLIQFYSSVIGVTARLRST